MGLFEKFLKDTSGATAIEYGLIASLISVAIIAALNNFGGALEGTFNTVEDSVVNAGK